MKYFNFFVRIFKIFKNFSCAACGSSLLKILGYGPPMPTGPPSTWLGPPSNKILVTSLYLANQKTRFSRLRISITINTHILLGGPNFLLGGRPHRPPSWLRPWDKMKKRTVEVQYYSKRRFEKKGFCLHSIHKLSVYIQ